jgi:hypothetical protein
MTASVAYGFPSPAEDSMDQLIDLEELHGIGSTSLFLARVHGDSMIGIGLHHSDIAVVIKAVEAKHSRIVAACLNGVFRLETDQVKHGRVILHPENSAFPDIEVLTEVDLQVWASSPAARACSKPVPGHAEAVLRLAGTGDCDQGHSEAALNDHPDPSWRHPCAGLFADLGGRDRATRPG